MKKIKDERLVLKNLQNIRIAYLIQTIGIVGILAYDFITKGREGMLENPLWMVFVHTGMVQAYLLMSISVDHEEPRKSPKKGLSISLLVLVLISVLVGVLTSLSQGFTAIDGALIGGIILICGIVPILYLYNLRKKAMDEDVEE